MKRKSVWGYTLLELSIVLVVIGIATGAVLYGKALIQTGRVKNVITDEDSYVSAVVNFKQAYGGLPGDITNAETLWGTDSLGCPNGGGPTGTCNGIGIGEITTLGGNEIFRLWQQLYLANMLPQHLSGVQGPAGPFDSVPGVNVPSSSLKGAGFSIYWLGVMPGSSVYPNGNYGNPIYFGQRVIGNLTLDPVLTPAEAQYIDTKIDDGLPQTGTVRTFFIASVHAPNCLWSNNLGYNTGYSGPACPLIFIPGF